MMHLQQDLSGDRLSGMDATTGAGEDGAARLAAELAEAECRERGRLAEALHDDALQRLLAARQDLGEAHGDPAALQAVGRQLAELTESLRTLTRAMDEETLGGLPLDAAVGRLADDAARRGRLAVRTRVESGVSGDHDPFVLGLVRELLANVLNHAHATSVDVSVAVEQDTVVLRVADDGRGMTQDEIERAGRTGHLGHARLRRRLTAIGGRMELDSSPLTGTTVTCALPRAPLEAQRTLEDALRRERRWSAALVAAMQDGFVVFRDAVAVQVNDRLCAMTGFSREELLGRRIEEGPFWSSEGLEAIAGLQRDARQPGGAELKTALLRRDATRFPALLAARTIHDDAGGVAGLLVTVKDITTLEVTAERRRLELELGAVVASTNRLRGLLEAARAVEDEDGLGALLAEIARTISEDLGWTVVINLYRAAWDDFVVSTGHGVPPEGWEILEGATYHWAEWTPFLDDRFERRGAYFVPAGEPADAPAGLVTWAPATYEREGPDAWRADDDLLIPFRHTHGHFLGILSLDAPSSGRRPSDAELDVLVAIAAHAALAVQHAQDAIETARHAAALDRLLEVSSQIAATRDVAPMLLAVAEAIAEALDFEWVVVEVVASDNQLAPLARRLPEGEPEHPLPPLRPGELAMLLDPAFAVEGCFVLGRDEARDRMPAARRGLLSSSRNGRGWRAWDDHVVLVPLHGADDEIVGVLWVGDPADRLLPSNDRLKALHAFANQATAALIAAARYRLLEGVADGDPLTRLGNRRALARELEREVARTGRTGVSSAVVLVDVRGCPALEPGAPIARTGGPGPLAVAEVFESELRRSDRAFRVEGGLFGLLLTGADGPAAAEAVALRIAARLEALSPGTVRVNLGSTTIGATDESSQRALRRAGTSLLEAREVRSDGAAQGAA